MAFDESTISQNSPNRAEWFIQTAPRTDLHKPNNYHRNRGKSFLFISTNKKCRTLMWVGYRNKCKRSRSLHLVFVFHLQTIKRRPTDNPIQTCQKADKGGQGTCNTLNQSMYDELSHRPPTLSRLGTKSEALLHNNSWGTSEIQWKRL